MVPDHDPTPSSSATAPFIVSIITERPGAVAILNRTAEPESRSWNHVLRLTSPRRGKRFSRNTEAGSLLHALHADGLLGPVFINLPEAHAAITGDDTIRDPDILHLVRS